MTHESRRSGELSPPIAESRGRSRLVVRGGDHGWDVNGLTPELRAEIQQQQCGGDSSLSERAHADMLAMSSRSLMCDDRLSICSGATVQRCDLDLVMRQYRGMMRGPVRQVYQAGYRGELYARAQGGGSRLTRAVDKLSALESAVRGAMVDTVSPKLCAEWQLYNSNIFPRAWGEASGIAMEDSPVICTLNCAPVDDGSACLAAASGAPQWTPDYLTELLSVLVEEGYFPPDVVPLVLEFRPICPLSVALTTHNTTLDEISRGRSCASAYMGWHCGSYAESNTSKADRELWGSYSALAHGSATKSWICVAQSKAITNLKLNDCVARSDFVASGAQPRPGGLRTVAQPFISSMGPDGGLPVEEEEKTAASTAATAGGSASAARADADPELSLGKDIDLTREPSKRRLRLCIDAIHPGRDFYLAGAALERNVRAWATIGVVLQDMRSEVDAFYADAAGSANPEPGLSPELAERALDIACRAGADLDHSGELTTMAENIATRLVARGHGHVFEDGPYAHLVVHVRV